VKFRDYKERWLELEPSINPFATLVMAHLKTRATRKDPEERLRWKMRLVRRPFPEERWLPVFLLPLVRRRHPPSRQILPRPLLIDETILLRRVESEVWIA